MKARVETYARSAADPVTVVPLTTPAPGIFRPRSISSNKAALPPGARHIKCVEELVLENANGVQRNSTPQPRALRADVGEIQQPVLRDLALNPEVEVLNVRRPAVLVIHGKRVTPAAIDRNRTEHRKLLWYGQRQVWERQIIR